MMSQLILFIILIQNMSHLSFLFPVPRFPAEAGEGKGMFPSQGIPEKLPGNSPSSFPSEVGEGKRNSPFPGKFPVPHEFHYW